MKKISILLFFWFLTAFVYSQQKVEYYSYGYDGMESVSNVRGSDSMVIYSNYKSRPLIRREVCDSVLKNYRKLKNGPYITYITNAKVIGKLELVREHNLVSIKYFYERVEYLDGLIEIYKSPVIKPKKKSKKRVMR